MRYRQVAGPEHTPEEVLEALLSADAAAIATQEGAGVRLRMMHHAPAEDFTIYLASLKGDPKIRQILACPGVAVLTRTAADREADIREVEVIGRVERVRDQGEAGVALGLTAERSSIVRALRDAGNTGILDFLVVRPRTVKLRVFADIVQGKPPTILEFDDEPAGEGPGLREHLRIWAATVRAAFLPAALLPVVLGVVLGWTAKGRLAVGSALLTLFGIAAAHLGANLINDVSDQDTDAANVGFVSPFSGGSRAIQLGLTSPAAMTAAALVCFGFAVLAGAVLAWTATPWILPIAAAGGLGALSYSILPRLAARGLGELTVAACFGPLVALGGFVVQTHRLSWIPVEASAPLAFLVAAILYVNELLDIDADALVGKRTWAVRLPSLARLLVLALLGTAAFGSLVTLVALDRLPGSTLVALMAFPLVPWAVRVAARAESPAEHAPANAAIIVCHLLVGLSLVVALATAQLHGSTGVQAGAAAGAALAVGGLNTLRMTRRRAGLEQVAEGLGATAQVG